MLRPSRTRPRRTLHRCTKCQSSQAMDCFAPVHISYFLDGLSNLPLVNRGMGLRALGKRLRVSCGYWLDHLCWDVQTLIEDRWLVDAGSLQPRFSNKRYFESFSMICQSSAVTGYGSPGCRKALYHSSEPQCIRRSRRAVVP